MLGWMKHLYQVNKIPIFNQREGEIEGEGEGEAEYAGYKTCNYNNYYDY